MGAKQNWSVAFGATDEALGFLGVIAAHATKWGVTEVSWAGRLVCASTDKPWDRVPGVVQAIDRLAGKVLGSAPAASPALPAKRPAKDKLRSEEPTADVVRQTVADLLRRYPDRGSGLAQISFGDDKVFVSAVWDELHREYAVTLARFKELALAFHRAGKVSLSRADLVEALDPKVLDRSEIRSMSSTFHFLRRA